MSQNYTLLSLRSCRSDFFRNKELGTVQGLENAIEGLKLAQEAYHTVNSLNIPLDHNEVVEWANKSLCVYCGSELTGGLILGEGEEGKYHKNCKVMYGK